MPKPRILRIFARYQQFAGEERVARKIHEDLMPLMDADWFEGSTDELLGNRLIDRLAAPLKVIHHEAAAWRFRELIRKARYDALEIHSVLPALSPAIYAAAFDLGLPIIHFLHNYRLSCVNGSFLNHTGNHAADAFTVIFFPPSKQNVGGRAVSLAASWELLSSEFVDSERLTESAPG